MKFSVFFPVYNVPVLMKNKMKKFHQLKTIVYQKYPHFNTLHNLVRFTV